MYGTWAAFFHVCRSGITLSRSVAQITWNMYNIPGLILNIVCNIYVHWKMCGRTNERERAHAHVLVIQIEFSFHFRLATLHKHTLCVLVFGVFFVLYIDSSRMVWGGFHVAVLWPSLLFIGGVLVFQSVFSICISCICFFFFPSFEWKWKADSQQRRRRQCRRKSWYDDGDNIVWSRIACAFFPHTIFRVFRLGTPAVRVLYTIFFSAHTKYF